MAKVMITQAKLEALADALRAKLGFTGKKTLAQLTQAVSDFDAGTDTSDATGGAAQMLSGYTAYGAGGKFTGSIQSLGAQTFQPSTSDQTIPAGKYLSGAQKIAKMVLQEKVVTLSTSQQVLTPPSGVHGFSKVTVPAMTYTGGRYYDTSDQTPVDSAPVVQGASLLVCGSLPMLQDVIPSTGTYIVFAVCQNPTATSRSCDALVLENGVLKHEDLSSSITIVTNSLGKPYVHFPYPFFVDHFINAACI